MHSRWLLVAGVALASISAADTQRVTFRKGCDFPVVDANGLGPEEFQHLLVQRGVPALLVNATGVKEWPAMEKWQWSNLRKAFHGVSLRVGPGPYPEDSMYIDQYLNQADVAFRNGHEVPGVFQYGQVPTTWSLWAHKDTCVPSVAFLHPSSEPIHYDFELACSLLANVKVPDFIVGDHMYKGTPPNHISHSGVLMGYQGSGIDLHKHQAAINVIFHGRKEWMLKVDTGVVEKNVHMFPKQADRYCSGPDGKADHVCTEHAAQQPLARAGEAERIAASGEKLDSWPAWEKYHLGAFAKRIKAKRSTEVLAQGQTELLRCEQARGEIFFIPGETPHAVQNLAETVAMQMQWNSDFYKQTSERMRFYHHLLFNLDPLSEPDPDYVDNDVILMQNKQKLGIGGT